MRELIADVFRNARLIAVALVIPPIVAVAVAFVLPPEYQADAKILIKPGREFLPSTNPGQNDNGLPSTTMTEVVKSEAEILNSSASPASSPTTRPIRAAARRSTARSPPSAGSSTSSRSISPTCCRPRSAASSRRPRSRC
jgi:hypothetical protein